MTKTTFLTVLGEAWPEPSERQHSKRTAQCPTLARVISAAKTGWRPEEEHHARKCQYCSQLVARVWQDYPPSWREIVQYASAPELSVNTLAMQVYTTGAGQRRYAIARRLNDLMATRIAVRKQLENLLDRAILVDAPLPVPTAAAAYAQAKSKAFAIEAEIPGEDIVVHVFNNEQDELGVTATGPTPTHGTTVHVDLVGAGEPLSFDVVVGAKSALIIGPFEAILRRIGMDCVMATYVLRGE